MSILEGVKPERPLFYFEKTSSIPHGSRNTKAISDYCVSFAREHNLEYLQDKSGNVIIRRKASKGYENAPVVIMQGHIDMVCEKEADCDIDFENEALRLKVENNILSAEGTTLGGDDGVAVCFMLAVLENPEIMAPELECVFTVDEEIGMLGAKDLDMSSLKGRMMINLDHGEEGSLLVGCAGGVTATAHLPIKYTEAEGLKYRISISNLTGGHSGEMIDKQRANANVLLGRVLNNLSGSISLISAAGGLKDNAIPRQAEALVVIDKSADAVFLKTVADCEKTFKEEYSFTDKDMSVEAVLLDENVREKVFDSDSLIKAVGIMCNLPAGIQKMSQKIPGLVQTSLNMGIMKLYDNEMIYSFSVRSDVRSEKEELCSRMEALLKMAGGYMNYEGDYPAWEMKMNSKLQKIATETFAELFGKQMTVGTIHAGLECGLFSDSLEGLDCISIGPDMRDIHTPQEILDLESTARYWDYLLCILERIK